MLIEQDSWYRDLSSEELADVASYNFDHPDAFAFDEMVQCLRALKQGQPVEIPQYVFWVPTCTLFCHYAWEDGLEPYNAMQV